MFKYQYKFEGTSEIREYKDKRSTMSADTFCACILTNIFKGKAPCGLRLMGNDSHVHCNSIIYVLKRDYAQKFKKGEVRKTSPVKLKKKRRRWRSPKKRWRSNSPKVRKISIN